MWRIVQSLALAIFHFMMQSTWVCGFTVTNKTDNALLFAGCIDMLLIAHNNLSEQAGVCTLLSNKVRCLFWILFQVLWVSCFDLGQSNIFLCFSVNSCVDLYIYVYFIKGNGGKDKCVVLQKYFPWWEQVLYEYAIITKVLAPEHSFNGSETVFRQGTKYLNTINEKDFCSNDNPPRELFSTRPVYFVIVAKTVLMSWNCQVKTPVMSYSFSCVFQEMVLLNSSKLPSIFKVKVWECPV